MPRHRRATSVARPLLPAGGLAFLARWASTWGLPELGVRTRVEVNPRLRRALACCRPVAGVIHLSPRVVTGDGRRVFAEALCHEFAHLAVRARYRRRRTAPHGPEWKALMVQAGFAPRARLDLGGASRAEAAGATRPEVRYLHRCPVCHASRPARRPMLAWRCPDCVAAGLAGTLLIESRPAHRPAPGAGRR